jgi:ABC-2 type transport system ATP-binding protein
MDEAEHLADRVLVMSHGSLIADGTSADLTKQIGASSMITFRLPEQTLSSELPPIDGHVDTFGPRVEIRTADPTAVLLTLLQWAAAHGGLLQALTVERPSLEDVYLELTARDETSRADDD